MPRAKAVFSKRIKYKDASETYYFDIQIFVLETLYSILNKIHQQEIKILVLLLYHA